MTSFTVAWGQAVVRFRWLILGITLALLVVAGIRLGTHGIYYDNANETYFLDNDPNLVAFDNLLENFGDTEYLIVGIEARANDTDVFNAPTIQMLDAITEFLENHRHVTQVRSLSKYQYTHDDDGLLATDDLFEEIETLAEDPSALNHARTIMAGEKLALDSLITPDFKHTRIAARVEYIKEENYHNVALVTDLKNFIKAQGYAEQGFNIHLSGSPYINEHFETITKQDQSILNPAMGAILTIILIAVFRSATATVIPAIIILTTLTLLSGLQSALNFPNTAVTSALIPTMIILCLGATVHVLVEFYHLRRTGLTQQQAAAETARDLFFAILFTSLTTAFGFIALAITEVKPVQQFALLAATGSMMIFVLASTVLPALMSFVPWIARPSQSTESGQHSKMTLFLAKHVPDFAYKNRVIIIFIGAAITVFSLYSISFIRADSNVANYFKNDSEINRDLNYFNDIWKGISNLEVIVDSGEEGGIKNPALLQRVDDLQQWLESLPESGQAISALDFYKQINQALNEDQETYYQLPDSRELAAQFLLLYENTGPNEDLSDLKDFNEQLLRLSIPITNMDEAYMSRLLNRITQEIDRNYSDLNLQLTGSMVMNHALNVYVNKGMLQSFGIAILVIGLTFLVLFRSLKYGAIALIPSIVPVILTGGIISLAGVAMDMGTMIVGAMTIGLAVDDSIHIMSRYRLMRSRNHSVHDAIEFAMQSSGKAVVLTSIILVCGFSVMLLGRFIPYIYVGLFSASIMVLALLGDLVFMPALLYIFDSKDKKVRSSESEIAVLNTTIPSELKTEVSEHA